MIAIEDFLARLECVTPNGENRWMARCPAHPDGNPSMSVALGDNGGILVKCFAGCSAEEIVAAMGLKMGDLMPDDGKRKRAGGRGGKKPRKAKKAPSPLPSSVAPKKPRDYGKHVRYYYYQDASGANVFRVDRRVKDDGKKTFIQEHPDPSSEYGWSWGLTKAGVKRVPFRLPKVIEAAKAGHAVVVLEGEKDVETFERVVGGVATCNPGGAGKWESGWGEYFEGVRKVLIVADRDPDEVEDERTGEMKPFAVGQKHACDVEAKLRADGYEGEIRKMVMPPIFVEQGVSKIAKDFTDWVEETERITGGKVDRAAFLAAVKAAEPWPDKWSFGKADPGDLKRAQKSARNTASSDAPQEEEEKRPQTNDGRGKMGEAGRFGRLCPRSPFKERECYEVDFQMDPGEIARLIVCGDEVQFEGWRRSDRNENRGEFVQFAVYDPIKCPLSRMVNMVNGCMQSFHSQFKLTNHQRTELTCSLALAWLRSRGTFFADADNPMYATSLYFDKVAGVLYGVRSDEFLSFLATVANVDRDNIVFKYMIARIEDMTMIAEETQRVRPSKEWDRRGNVIYISNGDSRLYRISANKIEDLPNGTDGVVFLRGATLKTFKVLDGPGIDPFVGSMLFRYAALEKQSDVVNCKLWVLNLFACHTNKPILLVNGPRGSGKTFLLQGIKQFLGIRTDGQIDDTVNKMDHSDKGSQDFWIIIDKGRFEIFDNFDYKIKWADNDLQTASTNGSHKTRELYKTSVLVTQFARACVALTSNNAVFASEGGGLPDRIITVKTSGRPKVSKGPGELLADNMANRDQYLTYIVKTLAAALADEKPVDANINQRHPEYAEFSVRCGRAMGCEDVVVKALSTAEIEKAVLPLMNDTVAKEVVNVLVSQPQPGNMSFTAGDMSDRIISRFGDETDEKTRTIYGSRRVGKVFQRFGEDFRTLFKWTTGMTDGKTRYDFTGLSSRGEAVLDSLKSGLVGFNGQISENPYIDEGTGDLFKNAPSNPLNPLHARALPQSSSFTREEEDNGSLGNGVNNGDLEDLDDIDI